MSKRPFIMLVLALAPSACDFAQEGSNDIATLTMSLESVNSQAKGGPTIRCHHGVDADKDGFCAGTVPGADCADDDGAIHPGAPEVCGNVKDDDCDGILDEDGCCWDADGDGYCPRPPQVCEPNTCCWLPHWDCNDSDGAIRPLATEVCWNGLDDNCNCQYSEKCKGKCNGCPDP